ncbi:hypothetical protein NUU61_001710 [Penicillium alfredii]|uniref:PH domain-containing protein n=1 Tax=Penicillium alfredii TaxID=1506179 RepID=A0A9W9FQ70_9EURO|nr:uncharacterized protein NUU61_001710 [Penicillium alfredii]KAJ5104363.1 hypothetical protein NUU61_001710 [Penicillium alfredii]
MRLNQGPLPSDQELFQKMGKHNVDVAVQAAPIKFSRYQSVRNAFSPPRDAEDRDGLNASPAPVGAGNDLNQPKPSIARSMSRYRRNRPSANSTSSTVPPMSSKTNPTRSMSTPQLPGPARQIPQDRYQDQGLVEQFELLGMNPTGMAQGEQERERHRRHAAEQLTGESQPSRSIPGRSNTSENVSQYETRQEGRRRVDTNETQASANEANRKSFLQNLKLPRTKESSMQHTTPKYIEVGGGGIVPGIDAPVSAVNAGERRVVVQHGETSVELPVTPSTQVQDLLLAATEHLSKDIDPEKFILLESFRKLGLQRSLRRYEYVRDVMNSWSQDSDNHLVVIPPSSIDALEQLDAQHVPSEQPAEATVHLYYSQRPGKWDKRFVTLRADGQVTISKKENGKDQTNICHLSDFDIYSPSARVMAKDIKPPKKICFAIKSQQKSSMFLSTENFVHFFTTNDKSIADNWYRVAQKWRSWYLVNKLGALQKTETEASLPKRSLTHRSICRPRKRSNEVAKSDWKTGDAETLMPVRGSMDQQRPTSTKDLFTRKKTLREHAPPPNSFPRTLAIDTSIAEQSVEKGTLVQGVSPEEVEAATFAPTGLLGRTYTQRQHAMREREEKEKQAKQDPFATHGLLDSPSMHSIPQPSGSQNSRSNMMTYAPEGFLSRASSIHQKNKPLVDLTPVFHEPPQHTRKGRGVTVEPGMPLIDAATGPDLMPESMAIPPATAWRRPAADIPPQARSRSNTVRSMHNSVRHASQSQKASTSTPSSPNNPFIPNSLLACSSRVSSSQCRTYTGHGVATGDRSATRPMLDMSPDNPFAEGSLLRQL